jgi:hypothetical protein
MNKLKLVLFFCLAALSCAKDKEVIIREDTTKTNPKGSEANQGGGDWGGGGVITAPDGSELSIDQLIENPRSRDDFAASKSILENLSYSFEQLASDFEHIVQHRIWYFVPTELKKLPSYITGIGTAVDFKQIALQNQSSIWVDKVMFEKNDFSVEQRTYIYIHELVVGLKVLDKTSSLDQCLAKASKWLTKKNYNLDEYKSNERSCKLKYLVDNKSIDIKISNSEYDFIRLLTKTIVSNDGKVEAEYLHLLLHTNGFERYKLDSEKVKEASAKYN